MPVDEHRQCAVSKPGTCPALKLAHTVVGMQRPALSLPVMDYALQAGAMHLLVDQRSHLAGSIAVPARSSAVE